MGSIACLRVNGVKCDWVDNIVVVHQQCVMLPWLFSIYTDWVMRKAKLRMLARCLNLVYKPNVNNTSVTFDVWR